MTLISAMKPELEEAAPRGLERGWCVGVIVMGNNHPAPRVHAGVAMVKRTR